MSHQQDPFPDKELKTRYVDAFMRGNRDARTTYSNPYSPGTLLHDAYWAGFKSGGGKCRSVKIERCQSPSFWYAKLVGKAIVIEFEDADGYWAREGGPFNPINVIRKTDATPIET